MATSTSNFLYHAGTFTTIHLPGVADFDVSGINDSGALVGDMGSGTATIGFMYSGGILTPITVPGAEFTVAKGINDSGQIVGTFELPPPPLHQNPPR